MKIKATVPSHWRSRSGDPLHKSMDPLNVDLPASVEDFLCQWTLKKVVKELKESRGGTLPKAERVAAKYVKHSAHEYLKYCGIQRRASARTVQPGIPIEQMGGSIALPSCDDRRDEPFGESVLSLPEDERLPALRKRFIRCAKNTLYIQPHHEVLTKLITLAGPAPASGLSGRGRGQIPSRVGAPMMVAYACIRWWRVNWSKHRLRRNGREAVLSLLRSRKFGCPDPDPVVALDREHDRSFESWIREHLKLLTDFVSAAAASAKKPHGSRSETGTDSDDRQPIEWEEIFRRRLAAVSQHVTKLIRAGAPIRGVNAAADRPLHAEFPINRTALHRIAPAISESNWDKTLERLRKTLPQLEDYIDQRRGSLFSPTDGADPEATP